MIWAKIQPMPAWHAMSTAGNPPLQEEVIDIRVRPAKYPCSRLSVVRWDTGPSDGSSYQASVLPDSNESQNTMNSGGVPSLNSTAVDQTFAPQVALLAPIS